MPYKDNAKGVHYWLDQRCSKGCRGMSFQIIWNIVYSAMISLPCPVCNCKTIWFLNCVKWENKMSQDFMLNGFQREMLYFDIPMLAWRVVPYCPYIPYCSHIHIQYTTNSYFVMLFVVWYRCILTIPFGISNWYQDNYNIRAMLNAEISSAA